MAGHLVVTEWQRNRQERLQQFLVHGFDKLGPEWIENSGISTSNVQLTLEQMKELTDRLDAVVTGYVNQFRNQRVAGARPVQVHIDVFPLVDGSVQGSGDVGGSEKDEQ